MTINLRGAEGRTKILTPKKLGILTSNYSSLTRQISSKL